MKVWITKYALTQGIIEAETNCNGWAEEIYAFWRKDNKNYSGFFCKSNFDFFSDKKSAIARAEAMRQKKIESLKKQINKLEAMKFE